MKITVLFPTHDEARFFTRQDVTVATCGVGLIAATYGTYKAIEQTKPDLIIMGGIAGVYEGSRYKIGDTILIKEEIVADLGFFYPEGFKHISDMSLDMTFDAHKSFTCPFVDTELGLPLGVSNSMNAAMAPFVSTEGVDVENMEGASFFYAAQNLQVPFLEVRSISNLVDLNREPWDYDSSIKNLAKGLNTIVDRLIKL